MKRYVELALKICVVFIFLSLTIRDVVRLFFEYCDGNAVTVAKANWNNDTIYMRNLSLCLTLTPLQWWKEEYASDVNAWSANLKETYKNAKAIISDKSIFDVALNTKNVNNNYDPNVAFAVALFNDVSTYFGISMGLKRSFLQDNASQATFADTYLWTSNFNTDHFAAYDAFVSDPIKAHKLELQIARRLCQKFAPMLQAAKYDVRLDLCDTETILRHSPRLLVPTMLCIPIPLALFNLKRDTQPPLFNISPDTAYVQSADRNWLYQGLIHTHDSRPYLDGSMVYRASTEFSMSKRINSYVDMKVEVDGVFRTLVGKPCVEALSERDCLLICKVKSIIDQCACNPFFYRHLMTDAQIAKGRFCKTIDYLTCANATYDAYTNDCADRACRNLCSYTKYNWNYKITQEIGNLTVYFTSTSFFYVRFEQMFKTSRSEFYSQLGGIIGLYLGLSGWTICTFGVVLLKSFESRKKRPQIRDQQCDAKSQVKSIFSFLKLLRPHENETATDMRLANLETKVANLLTIHEEVQNQSMLAIEEKIAAIDRLLMDVSNKFASLENRNIDRIADHVSKF